MQTFIEIIIEFFLTLFAGRQKEAPKPEIKAEAETPMPSPVNTLPLNKEHIPSAVKQHQQRYMWLLNKSHGKLQAGKRSVLFDDGKTQFMEYLFSGDIVDRIIKQLDNLGIAYHDVVPDQNKVGKFLKGRITRANEYETNLPKIWLSIHSNASQTNNDGWGRATGIETWHHAESKKGKIYSSIFQRHLVGALGWKDRGLKNTNIKNLYELRETHMPAILTETGFFTNKKQALELMKEDVRQKIANAHIAAILEIEKNGL